MAEISLDKKAAWLRRVIFEMLSKAEQGHPGSVLSLVEIMVTLFYGGIFRYKAGNPEDPGRDRVIISKGHAAMILYPIFADIGFLDKDELGLFGTPEGILRIFSNTSIPGIDATSGSLGHGLGIGAGYAMAAKYDGQPSRVFVVLSEGEMYEGSTWESALFASHRELDNLVVILDRNRNIILGDTEESLRLEPIEEKWQSFGFDVVSVDGHSFSELEEAFENIDNLNGGPVAIVANTVKGKGIALMEDDASWHYWQGMDTATREMIQSQLQAVEEAIQ
jgi:transketolase|tara:strand:+ start:515 stop:1348 length:834 start_codon:yes stop_codon:yes gene_type:complete